ncbi:hypothetical protein AYI68_g7034 [Smittium mucronatum]|uniref:Uncharacterized protein n=1 Tax=Smittium mucronatum TaxID=133383 RepID=A0A1R0GPT9_9FUNG|nr:hypothetical protein AYI68_g7034 [Smittium mucronatum]
MSETNIPQVPEADNQQEISPKIVQKNELLSTGDNNDTHFVLEKSPLNVKDMEIKIIHSPKKAGVKAQISNKSIKHLSISSKNMKPVSMNKNDVTTVNIEQLGEI